MRTGLFDGPIPEEVKRFKICERFKMTARAYEDDLGYVHDQWLAFIDAEHRAANGD